ncbi:MAG: hypothetical protein CL917_10390 [Deltaproteobacteria bacterium]|nr:hypothetical protein [Deltaproteobacteria bacterium]
MHGTQMENWTHRHTFGTQEVHGIEPFRITSRAVFTQKESQHGPHEARAQKPILRAAFRLMGLSDRSRSPGASVPLGRDHSE